VAPGLSSRTRAGRPSAGASRARSDR
jgi:hypothetical protein